MDHLDIAIYIDDLEDAKNILRPEDDYGKISY